MRVLHVMGRFAASGTERQLVSTMMAALAEQYWEPSLLVLRPGSPFVEEATRGGISVLEMPPYHDWDPRRVVAFQHAVRHGHPDVIHSSLWGANAFARLAAPIGRHSPIVISERRVEDYRRFAARRIDRILRVRTAGYIGNSDAVADFIVQAHGVPRERVSVIRNGIDGSVFNPGSTPRGTTIGPLRVGAMGRLVALKGYDVLIDAVRSLHLTLDITVEIAGAGPELERLSAAAAGLPITFIGTIEERGQVADFFRSLDVFVHPSHAEGLPNVVLEASACGTMVVATDAPGIHEALPWATLVTPGDPNELADAIKVALLEPRGLTGMGQYSQTFQQAAEEHRAAFESALARPVRARSTIGQVRE